MELCFDSYFYEINGSNKIKINRWYYKSNWKIDAKPDTVKTVKIIETVKEEIVNKPIENIIKHEVLKQEIKEITNEELALNIAPLEIIDAIPKLEFETPLMNFQWLSLNKILWKKSKKRDWNRKSSRSFYNPIEEVEYVPFEDESDESSDLYTRLTEKSLW